MHPSASYVRAGKKTTLVRDLLGLFGLIVAKATPLAALGMIVAGSHRLMVTSVFIGLFVWLSILGAALAMWRPEALYGTGLEPARRPLRRACLPPPACGGRAGEGGRLRSCIDARPRHPLAQNWESAGG